MVAVMPKSLLEQLPKTVARRRQLAEELLEGGEARCRETRKKRAGMGDVGIAAAAQGAVKEGHLVDDIPGKPVKGGRRSTKLSRRLPACGWGNYDSRRFASGSGCNGASGCGHAHATPEHVASLNHSGAE